MHPAQLFIIAAVSSSTIAAAPQTGRFECEYVGSWGCGPPSRNEDEVGGICIDGGGAAKRTGGKMFVDFDRGVIRLNSLAGTLEYSPASEAFSVFWEIAGVGSPRLAARVDDDRGVMVELRDIHPNGAMSKGEFACRLSRRGQR
jgi:hypothetical protein